MDEKHIDGGQVKTGLSSIREVGPRADLAAVLSCLRILVEPEAVAELRLPRSKRGVVSGYFNDLGGLASEACRWMLREILADPEYEEGNGA